MAGDVVAVDVLAARSFISTALANIGKNAAASGSLNVSPYINQNAPNSPGGRACPTSCQWCSARYSSWFDMPPVPPLSPVVAHLTEIHSTQIALAVPLSLQLPIFSAT